jgi:hypothetical protein
MSRHRFTTFVAGAIVGGVVAVLLDPRSGARRRALVRDKAGRYVRLTNRWARGRVRVTGGRVQGVVHDLARHAPGYTPEPPPDTDTFIKHRVESELGHASHLPLHAVNFDAVEGIVRVRGTVPDAQGAEEIVARAAAVEGVRAVISLMQTPDGTPVGGTAGDPAAIGGAPLGVVRSEEVRRRLLERWPSLTDDDIRASDGHIDRLVERIRTRTGQPEAEVRAALDEMLLAAT